MRGGIAAVLATMAVCAADAQLALPPVQLPRLPPVKLPVDIERTISGATSALDPQQLIDLRRLRVQQLLHDHRDVVESDPRGAPMVRAEVLAFSPTDAALASALAAGFTVARETVLEGLEARTVVLRAPAGMSTRKALQKLREMDRNGVYDFNHIYLDSGLMQEEQTAPASAAPSAATAGEPAIRVGLIDGGVDISHPALAGKTIHLHGCAGKPVPSAHGTAVASLLVGQAEKFSGAAPQAGLYAADVYCGAPAGGAADAIADSFAWLARERVGVINVSLVGPPNALLERVVSLVIARGHIVVAAVGNDGPAAPPLYPAAYPQVIGVTGVDGKHRVLLEALRGKQVDFAAPGADLVAANAAHSFAPVRGTSFAAPIVAGLLAAALSGTDKAAAARAIELLASRATDLGARGPDPVYGWGFLDSPARGAVSR